MGAIISILDDYQEVALSMADWSALRGRFALDVLTAHIADEDELVERLHDSEVIVAMRERTAFPASVLRRLPNLRLLVTTGPVNASIDVAAANAQGVVVSRTRYTGNAMPEIIMGMMIALTRHFVEEDRSIRAGGWQHTIGPGLAGHTLGLVGLGRLGQRVATLAQVFEMDVIAWSPHLTPERAAEAGVAAVSRDTLFATADIVSVHMVLTERTRGLVGRDDLRRMKSTAYFMNTSRGPLVDEAALLEVLVEQRIAGAALDVFDTEPLPIDHPLRRAPNTLLLPHIGYVTSDAYAGWYTDVVDDIVAFYDGAPVRVITADTNTK